MAVSITDEGVILGEPFGFAQGRLRDRRIGSRAGRIFALLTMTAFLFCLACRARPPRSSPASRLASLPTPLPRQWATRSLCGSGSDCTSVTSFWTPSRRSPEISHRACGFCRSRNCSAPTRECMRVSARIAFYRPGRRAVPIFGASFMRVVEGVSRATLPSDSAFVAHHSGASHGRQSVAQGHQGAGEASAIAVDLAGSPGGDVRRGLGSTSTPLEASRAESFCRAHDHRHPRAGANPIRDRACTPASGGGRELAVSRSNRSPL